MKYKYHDENSPRGFVHLVFDLYGENAALALGGHGHRDANEAHVLNVGLRPSKTSAMRA